MSRRHRIHLGDEVYDLAFKIRDIVYLRTRDEPVRGQVTGYQVRLGPVFYYLITWGNTGVEAGHFDFELSSSSFIVGDESPDEAELNADLSMEATP